MSGRPSLILVVDLEGRLEAFVSALHEEDAERLAIWLARTEDPNVRAATKLAHEIWKAAA